MHELPLAKSGSRMQQRCLRKKRAEQYAPRSIPFNSARLLKLQTRSAICEDQKFRFKQAQKKNNSLTAAGWPGPTCYRTKFQTSALTELAQTNRVLRSFDRFGTNGPTAREAVHRGPAIDSTLKDAETEACT